MPHTHPHMKDRSRPQSQPLPEIHHHPNPHQGPQTLHFHQPLPNSPQASISSSRFLSPVQDARIRSWRDHTLPDDPLPPSANNPRGHRSAPATLGVQSTSSGEHSSTHSRGHNQSQSQSQSREDRSSVYSYSNSKFKASSSALPHPSQHQRPSTQGHVPPAQRQGRMKSYYSNKKKGTTLTSTSTPPPPMTPSSRTPLPQPNQGVAPPSSMSMTMSPDQMTSYQRQAYEQSLQPHPQLQQQQQQQQQQEISAQIPPPVLARLPNEVPRIGGARDPITQN